MILYLGTSGLDHVWKHKPEHKVIKIFSQNMKTNNTPPIVW